MSLIMVRYLISRPIAVTMIFIAFLLVGIVAINKIPISLMPDIEIPRITVQIDNPNMSAREIENNIVKPIRNNLMQVSHLSDINSVTSDGYSNIYLTFEYGTNINLAYIEVNEKIDRIMSYLPESIKRPKVIKASASDIPVFYLNITLSDNETTTPSDNLFPVSQKFLDLSEFVRQVIKKRLEQLPEVALADVSGDVSQEIIIIPDEEKMKSLNITSVEIENIIKSNNISFGNLNIRDGQYLYSVRFTSEITSIKDIENIYINKNEKLIRLKEIAQVFIHPQKLKGKVISDDKNAISVAIIKQSDARMQDLKKSLDKLINIFKNDYPDINFSITRNQTTLLTFSINNLKQSLIAGAFLAFIIMFFFLKDFRSPLLIGITVPASLIISLLFFYVFKISINIISLSGLALGIGMIVDNSIVVIDNITQYKERNLSLVDSCIIGTNEVISPLISSVLTTCAVFVPLIYIKGIAGELFYDQAIAISIGLFVSLLLSILIIPVYYNKIFAKKHNYKLNIFLERLNKINYSDIYKKGFCVVMKYKTLVIIISLFLLISTYFLYKSLPKEKFPPMGKTEIFTKIRWNENINILENERRVKQLIKSVRNNFNHYTAYIGKQNFLFGTDYELKANEAIIYFKTDNEQDLIKLQKQINNFLKKEYSHSTFAYEDPANIFNQIFSDKEPTLLVKLRSRYDFGIDYNRYLSYTINKLKSRIKEIDIADIEWNEFILLKIDPSLLALFEIDIQSIFNALNKAISENEIFMIMTGETYIPVIIGEKPELFDEKLSKLTVINKHGTEIRIGDILKKEIKYDLNQIIAGEEGEYFPLKLNVEDNKISSLIASINNILKEDNYFEADFSGKYFSNRQLIKQLFIILLISLALLYLILASQFESLLLPLIILIEIPIDIFGAFLILKLANAGINIISMTGLILMCGIVINDSILKIDTINNLIKEGFSLYDAIKEAGIRRLKPIIMTSLTTILAVFPILLFGGMGNELQRPMALVIIGSMTLGTIISLYLIPILYYYLKKIEYQIIK